MGRLGRRHGMAGLAGPPEGAHLLIRAAASEQAAADFKSGVGPVGSGVVGAGEGRRTQKLFLAAMPLIKRPSAGAAYVPVSSLLTQAPMRPRSNRHCEISR